MSNYKFADVLPTMYAALERASEASGLGKCIAICKQASVGETLWVDGERTAKVLKARRMPVVGMDMFNFDKECLAACFGALFNEIKETAAQGEVVSCLTVQPDDILDTINLCDGGQTDACFTVTRYEFEGKSRYEVQSTWGMVL